MAVTASFSAQVRASVATRTTVVKASVKAKAKTVRRPSEEDPRREQWDRAARCTWRISIVLITIMISILSKDWELPETVAVIAEKIPEVIQETVEFFAKL